MDIRQTVFGIALAFMFQETTVKGTDYGGYITPIVGIILAAITVYGQIKQKRMENDITAAGIKQNAQSDVIKAWEKLFDKQDGQIRDLTRRLRGSEVHNRICEKTQMKLIFQLIKAGIEVDFESIMREITLVESEIGNMEVHTTIKDIGKEIIEEAQRENKTNNG